DLDGAEVATDALDERLNGGQVRHVAAVVLNQNAFGTAPIERPPELAARRVPVAANRRGGATHQRQTRSGGAGERERALCRDPFAPAGSQDDVSRGIHQVTAQVPRR